MANPVSSANIFGHPIHPMLIPFPIAFFVATFVCDLVFWYSGYPIWITAVTWLLGLGLVMAALAALAGLTDFLGNQQFARFRPHGSTHRQCDCGPDLLLQLLLALIP
jgi:uncharacterized membrane protein